MDYELLIKRLNLHGFKTHLLESSSEFPKLLCELISEKESVGFGGSMTLNALNAKNILQARGNTVIANDNESLLKARVADWYLSSTNALSMTGELVYIDGRSNRIGAIVDGPKKVMIVTGHNKITPDLASAIDRVRNVAAPPNAVRLNKKTPCAITGKCSYCNSPDCICNNTLIQHHPSPYGREVHIVIIKEDLGF